MIPGTTQSMLFLTLLLAGPASYAKDCLYKPDDVKIWSKENSLFSEKPSDVKIWNKEKKWGDDQWSGAPPTYWQYIREEL